MLEPQIPDNEAERLKALESYAILDTLEESDFDDITRLAAQISGKNIALISLVDRDRQWFKAKHGLAANETPRSVSFCGHAINTPQEPFIVPDSSTDARFSDNPLVTGDPHVAFYAGFPISDTEGFTLGTLCVIDDKPGEITPEQQEALAILSKSVMNLLSLRRKNSEIAKEKKLSEKALQDLEIISRFPDENPNPILRVDYYSSLKYTNAAAKNNFLPLISVEDGVIRESILTRAINELIENDLDQSHVAIEKNGNYFDINLVNLRTHQYINLYVYDKSKVMNETIEMKTFYETILDYFPIDIGVFTSEHVYLYVNKEGIKNDEIRRFMIGKTDYDYCDFRNVSYEMADRRRALFNQAKTENRIISWEEEFKLPDGEIKVVQRQYSPILSQEDSVKYMVGYGLDISSLKKTQQELNVQLNFMQLLSEIGQDFVGVKDAGFDQIVQRNLARIGTYIGAQRVYFYTYNFPQEQIELKHEWNIDRLVKLSHKHRYISLAVFPEWRVGPHLKNDPVLIHDTNLLEEGIYKNELIELSVKSFYSFPCINNNSCFGFIGVDFTEEPRSPTDLEMLLLNLFSQILSNSYMSIEHIKEIQSNNTLISKMNEDLETKIIEKTSENQELTQKISNLDKMAMIGELTSNIAHDLNTPIGSIKAASESVTYALERLFSTVLGKCTAEQIAWVYSRKIDAINISVSILDAMKEKEQWKKLFEEVYSYRDADQKLIIDGIVRNRILPEDAETVRYILEQPNKTELLELMYHTLVVRTFNDSILYSAERATDVIKNLRFYIREGKKESQEEIDIEDSIRTVLRVFQHELNKGVKVHLNKIHPLKVRSYEAKLYQLWANILKNAIDAMGGKGNIYITLYKEDDKNHITIANDGPRIPDNILPSIFNKFFTTKDRTSGTGLGLNIVKEIMDEHNGTIVVNSSDEETIFHFVFN